MEGNFQDFGVEECYSNQSNHTFDTASSSAIFVPSSPFALLSFILTVASKMKVSKALSLGLLAINSVSGFQPASFINRSKLTSSRLHAGKGFGAQPPPPEKKPKNERAAASTPAPVASKPAAPIKTAGQIELENLRRERAEKKDAELRKVKEIREIDASLVENPGAAAIPDKVATRMGSRMLTFVGVPLFGSLASFVVFWYLATYKDMEFQPAMVAFTTIALLAVGLIGITYSIFSTSWDEDREGSLMGLDEAQKNLDNVKAGLGRSRENLVVREQIANLSEREIETAISDLNRRDAAKEKVNED